MLLDEIDKKLINLLQNDSKQTTKQLSLYLKLSVTAVYERVKKLEKNEVIKKYVALVDRHKIDKSFMVFCNVKITRHSKQHVTDFEKEVLRHEEVSECFHINGDYDYLLKVYVKDMEAYREFMMTKLTTLKHVDSTHSIFVISEIKNDTQIMV